MCLKTLYSYHVEYANWENLRNFMSSLSFSRAKFQAAVERGLQCPSMALYLETMQNFDSAVEVIRSPFQKSKISFINVFRKPKNVYLTTENAC